MLLNKLIDWLNNGAVG